MLQFINRLLTPVWKRLFDVLRRAELRSHRPSRSKKRIIETLEIRITPVVGAFDIPAPLEPGSEFDGVAYVALATGALLTTGRHILTAAHVGDQNTGPGSGSSAKFTLLNAQGNPVNISTPPSERYPHDVEDIAVIELEELAPLTLPGYDIYTNTNELNHVATLVGYGHTGTGTTGVSTDIKTKDTHETDTGQETNYELVRFTVTGNPTGGFLVPRLSDEIPNVLAGVPYNTTAAQLKNALEGLPGIGDVQVRLVGDVDFDGDVDNQSNPYAGSFEALFLGAPAEDHSMANVIATHNFIGGNEPNILVETILQGGTSRAKRSGRNFIGEVTDTRIRGDFDDGSSAADTLADGLGQGANEAFNSGGDSGAPIFIAGLIAGVHKLRFEPGYDDSVKQTSDFGEVNEYIRVSKYQDFINRILDDPFNLVLNMENQPWGDDDIDDTISFSRVGNNLRIHIDGVLRYTESIGLIQSVTIRGSADDETITVGALGSFPIIVYGNGGDDTLRASAVFVGAIVALSGGFGDDTFYAGDGDLDDDIRGELFILGDTGEDTLYLDDTDDTNQIANIPDIYNFDAISFHKPNPWSASITFTSDLDAILLDANPNDNVVHVDATVSGQTLSIFTGAGNDSIFVGDGNIEVNLDGALIVNGGFGTDSLVIDDSNGPAGTHSLNNDSYTKSTATGSITFQFMQDIRLETGSFGDDVDVFGTSEDFDLTVNTHGGSDTVRVHSVHPQTEVAINTGSGNDTIEFSSDSRRLSNIDGSIVLDAGSGVSDDLILRDDNGLAARVTGKTYTVQASSFDVNGFGSLSYVNVEEMALWADQFDDTINVYGLVAAVDLTVRGGAGDDLFQISTGDLDSTIFGDLAIQGGDGEDTVHFNDGSDNLGNDSYLFSSNNFSKTLSQTWSYLQTENVVLNASSFDNTVQLSSVVPVNLTINAFLGNDTIELGSGRADLNQANIHVNGSLGNNAIRVNNQNAPGNRTYTFASQTFDMTGAFFDALSYTSIDHIILNAGASNDTINVQSSVISTVVEVFANGGMDTINVASGDVDSIGGDLVVHGGDSEDILIINDQDEVGNDTYNVTANQVSKPNFLLHFDGMETVTLYAGIDDNTININSSLSSTSWIVDAGAGKDTIHLSPLAQHLGQIQGPVTVNGQAGNDSVVAHDEVFAQGAVSPYTLMRSKLSRLGFGGLSFDTIELLELNMGSGNDIVNVQEFNLDTLFALYGNNGEDTFNVAINPSASNIGGSLFIDGGNPPNRTGSDRLNVTYATKPEVAKKPKVQHKKDKFTDGTGSISVEYPEVLFEIMYMGIEKVDIGAA